MLACLALLEQLPGRRNAEGRWESMGVTPVGVGPAAAEATPEDPHFWGCLHLHVNPSAAPSSKEHVIFCLFVWGSIFFPLGVKAHRTAWPWV